MEISFLLIIIYMDFIKVKTGSKNVLLNIKKKLNLPLRHQ